MRRGFQAPLSPLLQKTAHLGENPGKGGGASAEGRRGGRQPLSKHLVLGTGGSGLAGRVACLSESEVTGLDSPSPPHCPLLPSLRAAKFQGKKRVWAAVKERQSRQGSRKKRLSLGTSFTGKGTSIPRACQREGDGEGELPQKLQGSGVRGWG